MLETVAGTDAQAGEAAGGQFERVRGMAAAEARPPGYEPVNATDDIAACIKIGDVDRVAHEQGVHARAAGDQQCFDDGFGAQGRLGEQAAQVEERGLDDSRSSPANIGGCRYEESMTGCLGKLDA